MFELYGRTIRLSRGDTGVIPFRVEGVTLTDSDRAVFTVKSRSGQVILQKVLAPDGELFYMPFVNDETDDMKPGVYEWDLRVVLGAQLNSKGAVTDGREVITPWPPSKFEVSKVVGDV